ncbi:MAG TPA: class I SAM-dependent methyltransferase [Steroidobacteraceae bacterium]|nr:class I SAM-dependent methyltransferase [Steroidobacteraceae bacterium]
MSSHTSAALVELASAGYRDSGRFAWHFARAKLARDPVFAAILAGGLLEGCQRLLDLGCGQGLLAAWLFAARTLHAGAAPGTWPRDWPAPPLFERYTGVEINPREAARARALGAHFGLAHFRIVQADVRHLDYVEADAIVMLDVLHYLERASQESVLTRARAALAPGGRLLLRVGDAAGGIGFTVSRVVDTAVALARRRRLLRLYYRPLREWLAVLAGARFSARVVAQYRGPAFSNVVLMAQGA